MAAKNIALQVAFYGFDKIGFDLPEGPITLKKGAMVHFLALGDGPDFEEFHGVVVPQGVFESIEFKAGYMSRNTRVGVSRDLLLEKEHQVHNLLRENKWTCFLVGAIYDRVPGGYHERQIDDTDLCKRLLNAISIPWTGRTLHEGGLSGVAAKTNEFLEFVRQYGAAKMTFEFPYGRSDYRTLAEVSGRPVGFHFAGRLFFLPFHTTKKDEGALRALAKMLVEAILDYRQKQQTDIPEWAAAFRFKTEQSLEEELETLDKRASELQVELQGWHDFKALLTASGEPLREKVILVFERFFGYNVDPLDEGREDAKLLDAAGTPIALLEVKGTKHGIRREYVSQTDAHRDRNDLPATVPGILVINCQMDLPSLEKRNATTVDAEQIEHAVRNNVLILRTSELLLLMRHLEAMPDRKAAFSKLLSEGGGWLQVDGTGYRVVKA